MNVIRELMRYVGSNVWGLNTCSQIFSKCTLLHLSPLIQCLYERITDLVFKNTFVGMFLQLFEIDALFCWKDMKAKTGVEPLIQPSVSLLELLADG